MENITKIGKPGDIFINREGNECIWIASDGKGRHKYRFRLLSEHKIFQERIDYIKTRIPNYHVDIFKKFLHESYWEPYGSDKTFNIEIGDWYVRCDGCSSPCIKWEETLDLIKKKE